MRRKKKIIKAEDIDGDVPTPIKRKPKKAATKKRVAKKAAAKKAAKKVARKKKPMKAAPAVKARPPEAPAVHTASKTEEDPLESRFRALLPDIEGLTEKIIETDLDHTQAMEVTSRVDDLVDWAPNAIAWCQDKRFLGMAPFAKQCEILLHLFEEYCPRCSDMDYVRDIPVRDPIEAVLSKVALMEFGKCPHCGYDKAQGRADKVFIDPVELVAPVGQRSGKSAVTAMASSYLLHRNLMLPVPWKEYGLTPGQLLDFTFVATTMTQSERTLWATFKGMFTQSQWFKSYKEVCDTEGRKKGVLTTVKNLETYILFGHKNLLIYFAANDPSGLRGSTRVGGAIDELSWFGNKDGGKRANGKETYAALNNSCLTLRTAFADKLDEDPNCNWPLPMLFNVSSPVSMDDPLMTLYRDSAENPRAVRKHWATWEAHPKNTKKRLTELGEMAKPTADRDYGAQPPLAHNPLVSRTDIVTEAFKNPLATESRYGPIIRPYALGYTEEVETPIGARTAMMLTAGLVDKSQVPEPNWEALKALPEEELALLGASRSLFEGLIKRPPSQRMHIMGVDLGSSNNSLAVCCGFLSDDNRFVTDFLVEVNPRDTLTINVADVYENLIVKLVDELNVVAVFYDRWNSLHQIQDLASRFGSLGPLNDKVTRRSWLRKLTKMNKRPAFIADKYSLNMADATMLVSRLEQGDCLFPSMEVGFMDLMVNRHLDASAYPFTHLALQMATVRATGNRLLKPLNRDDDLFRAWANAAVPALKDELVMDLLKQDHRAQAGDRRGASNFHVSLGQGGKGIRPVSNLTTGAISTGPADFPVVVRRGTYRG